MGSSCSCSSDVKRVVNTQEIDLSHFELLKVVGKGGFGKVNAVQKVDTGELLAMKRMEKVRLAQRRDRADRAVATGQSHSEGIPYSDDVGGARDHVSCRSLQLPLRPQLRLPEQTGTVFHHAVYARHVLLDAWIL